MATYITNTPINIRDTEYLNLTFNTAGTHLIYTCPEGYSLITIFYYKFITRATSPTQNIKVGTLSPLLVSLWDTYTGTVGDGYQKEVLFNKDFGSILYLPEGSSLIVDGLGTLTSFGISLSVVNFKNS